MTFHRLMIACALFLAAAGLRLYLPETAEAAMADVRELIDQEEYVLWLPEEAGPWLDWP